MNLCASWYPVLIVEEDDSFFSPPSLALVFGISAWDPRARAGAGAASTDDEEPEVLLPLAGRFFFDFSGGVVTAQIRKKKKKKINQNQPS
jgi:hypothetical protein